MTKTAITSTDIQRACYICTKPAKFFVPVFAARTQTTQRPVCTKHSH